MFVTFFSSILLNPKCFIGATILYGIIIPQFLRLILGSFAFWVKWKVEMQHAEGCFLKFVHYWYAGEPTHITLSHTRTDELLEYVSIYDLQAYGIHFYTEYNITNIPSTWQLDTRPAATLWGSVLGVFGCFSDDSKRRPLALERNMDTNKSEPSN